MSEKRRPGHVSPAPGLRPRCPLCEARKGSRPCPRYEATVCRADCLRVRSTSLCPRGCRYLADLVASEYAPKDDIIYR